MRFAVASTWDGQPAHPDERVTIDVRCEMHSYVLTVDAPFHGDPAPGGPAGSFEGLWDYEVVEWFVVAADGRYVEVELGPHGHFLVLQLEGVRAYTARGLPIVYEAHIEGSRWRGVATLPRSLVPFARPHRANAFAIHGTGDARRYLASSAVPGAPVNLHQPERFPPFHIWSDWEAHLGPDARRAHDAWVERKRTGSGRIVLEDASLFECRVRGASFVAIRFVRCDLDRGSIAYSDMSDAELVDCSAVSSVLVHTQLYDARMERCQLAQSDLRRATLCDARLSGCDLSDALLVETGLVRCEVTDCDLRRARVGDSQLDHCQLTRCDLRDADLRLGSFYGTRFHHCDLRGARFDDRRMRDTAFIACQLDGTTGTPIVQGPVVVEACDVRPAWADAPPVPKAIPKRPPVAGDAAAGRRANRSTPRKRAPKRK